METSSSPPTFVGADRPFFTTRESLDDIQSLSSVNFARGDLSIGRYGRGRPGLGVSTPNPIAPMVMAVVILRARQGARWVARRSPCRSAGVGSRRAQLPGSARSVDDGPVRAI